MKLLEKKIYGFTILEIGLFGLIFMNLKTILNFFGLVTKPFEKVIDGAKDTQAKNDLGLTDQHLAFCKELAPKIKIHLDAFNVDEKALCKLLGDSLTSHQYWDIIQKFYNYEYQKDLKSELFSVLNGYDDWGFGSSYKTLLKRSFLISDLLD